MRITIHRALSELKILDDRIQKALLAVTPTGVYQDGKKVGVKTQEEFKADAEAALQSVRALIERKRLLKSLIVKSNAESTVTIGGTVYSVADAIVMKSIIEYKKKLADHVLSHYRASVASVNKMNEDVGKRLQNLLEVSFGRGNLANVSKDDLENISKPFLDANTYKLCDPLEAGKVAADLQDEYNAFTVEVDAALSESNAIQTIVIPE